MNVNRTLHRQLPRLAAASLGFMVASHIPTSAVAADLGVAPIYRANGARRQLDWLIHWHLGWWRLGQRSRAQRLHRRRSDPAFDLHGGIVGLTSGFNIQNGRFVYGYESDTSITSKRGMRSNSRLMGRSATK